MIGLILTTKGLYKSNYIDDSAPIQSEYQNGINFAQKNLKAIFLLFIPMIVFSLKMIYRKLNFNISEFSIIAVVNVFYFLLFALVSNIIYFLSAFLNFEISENTSAFFVYLGILSFIRVLYLTFQPYIKSKLVLFIKAMLTTLLFFVILLLTIMMMIAIAK
ncbi:hypothetical protein [Sediminibacterium salmoneum]|uniref:hypothetical protein n=1 Tax=Sediminibacterium salmoneum TaxID=426421 RepID=UPI00047BF865|nr:hypothetical protein [Sediminibacterium salmoneum]